MCLVYKRTVRRFAYTRHRHNPVVHTRLLHYRKLLGVPAPKPPLGRACVVVFIFFRRKNNVLYNYRRNSSNSDGSGGGGRRRRRYRRSRRHYPMGRTQHTATIGFNTMELHNNRVTPHGGARAREKCLTDDCDPIGSASIKCSCEGGKVSLRGLSNFKRYRGTGVEAAAAAS